MGGSGQDLGIAGLGPGVKIGEGGYAIVYRARQEDLDRDVAVKILRQATDETTRRRFDRERRAMGRLSQYEGIVTVYGTGFTASDEPYIIMPVLGQSLADELDTNGPMPWPEAVDLMIEVCDAVAHAHEQGIVHRDLKPSNILRSPSGRPLVADFGIARIVDSKTSVRSTALTLTPAYSPPESLETPAATPAADVYSLGATLHELIVGHPPFVHPGADDTLLNLLKRIVDDPVPDIRPHVPDAVQGVLNVALAKGRAERYPTAAELGAALRLARNVPVETSATAPPPTGTAGATTVIQRDDVTGGSGLHATVPRSRLRAPLVALTVAVLALGVVLVLALRSDSGDDDAIQTVATPDAGDASTDDGPAPPGDGDGAAGDDPAAVEDQPTTVPDSADQGGSDPDEPASAPEPPPVTSLDGEILGPATLAGRPILLEGDDTSVWTVVITATNTVARINPETFEQVDAPDFGFLAQRLATSDTAIYGNAFEQPELVRLDLATGDITAQRDYADGVRDLHLGDRWLWVLTNPPEGGAATLDRLDPETLEPSGSVELQDGDVVFGMASDGRRLWLQKSFEIVSLDAETLAREPAILVPINVIDDLSVAGGIVYASGIEFNHEDEDYDYATVALIDAETRALVGATRVSETFSRPDVVSVAATETGAWVVAETVDTAYFVDGAGTTRMATIVPDETNEVIVAGGRLWVLAGPTSGSALYRVDIPES